METKRCTTTSPGTIHFPFVPKYFTYKNIMHVYCHSQFMIDDLVPYVFFCFACCCSFGIAEPLVNFSLYLTKECNHTLTQVAVTSPSVQRTIFMFNQQLFLRHRQMHH